MGGPVHNAHQSIFTKLKSDVHLIWIKTQTKIRACLLFYFCIQHECELIWIWRAVSSFALTPCVFLRWQNQATRPYTPKSRWTFCVGAFQQSQSNFPTDMEIFSIWKVRTYLCVTTNDHLKHWILSVSFVNENDFDIRAKQSYYFSFLAKKKWNLIEKTIHARIKYSIDFSLEKLKMETYATTKGLLLFNDNMRTRIRCFQSHNF